MTERQKLFLLSTRVSNCTPGWTLRTIDINVNTTCHNIPLGGSGSSVTHAVPRPVAISALGLVGSTFSQSDRGATPIPTPFKARRHFRCFNGMLNCPRISAF